MVCRACGKESAEDFKFCPHCGKAFLTVPPVIDFTSVLTAVAVLAINPRALQAQVPTDGISPALLLVKANAGDAVLQEFVGGGSAVTPVENSPSATHCRMTWWIKCLQSGTLS
jgi:ribosomal protein L40E